MTEPMMDIHSEQSVIGACVIDNSVIERVMFLDSSEFYNHAHREIFDAIKECYKKGAVVDFGGLNSMTGPNVTYEYIGQVAGNTGSAANAVTYADRVRDMANRRKVHQRLLEAIESLHDTRVPSGKTVADVSTYLDREVHCKTQHSSYTVKDLITMTIDEMERNAEGVRVGIKSGIEEIDQRLGYKHLAFGEITVIGALSKNGKTLGANTIIARAGYEANETCHVFSVEMPALAMFNGMVSAASGVPANFYARQDAYLTHGQHGYDSMMSNWGKAAHEMSEADRITIDNESDVDADYICAGMEREYSLARQKGRRLRLVVIDHLHRMNFNAGSGPLTYAIRDTVRRIKNTADKLGVAVVLLAQLRNDCEGKDPTSFFILDSSSVRHELQAFIGFRMFREAGDVFFGVYADSQRYADVDTLIEPAYMKLSGGVLRSLPESQRHWTPKQDEDSQPPYRR
ncbi:MAG: hypothetical protein GY776_19905 [Alteromonas sp.]|nr:hypothetical protein [Alteromonas sp.]